MSIIHSQQIIHVNSRFRTGGTDDDFYTKIELNKGNRYDRVAVLSVSIPKSYYLVPEGENTFIVRDNNVDHIATVPVGNYSVASFIYVMNNTVFTGSNGLQHYSVSFPDSRTQAQTGKLTFSHINTQHSSTFIFGDNHLPEVMGFNRGSTNNFIIANNTSRLVSTNVCNFQREATLFLHSDIASNGGGDDILLELFASGSPDLSNINFENQGNLEEHSKLLTNNGSNIAHFYLTDENRQRINLNGINMLITLCFYEKNSIDSLIRGYIKYKTLADRKTEDNPQDETKQ